jgi:hypothetical protein
MGTQENKINTPMPPQSEDISADRITPISLDDAISRFNSLSDITDLSSFLHFIMNCLKNVNGFYEWFSKTHSKGQFQITVRNEKGFNTDLSQIRELYASMVLSKAN